MQNLIDTEDKTAYAIITLIHHKINNFSKAFIDVLFLTTKSRACFVLLCVCKYVVEAFIKERIFFHEG